MTNGQKEQDWFKFIRRTADEFYLNAEKTVLVIDNVKIMEHFIKYLKLEEQNNHHKTNRQFSIKENRE